MRAKIVSGCCVIVMIVGLVQGCGRAPQMSSSNRKILEALQTAVSAKKSEWLVAVENQIAEKRTKHEMSDTEFNAINSILINAKSGHWKEALKDSFALSEGQRPSAEDLASLKSHTTAKQAISN